MQTTHIGFESGRIIDKNVFNLDAPSISAASSNARGIPSKKFLKRIMRLSQILCKVYTRPPR